MDRGEHEISRLKVFALLFTFISSHITKPLLKGSGRSNMITKNNALVVILVKSIHHCPLEPLCRMAGSW